MHKPESIPAILYTLMFVKSADEFQPGAATIAQYRSVFSPEIRRRMLTDLEYVLQADPAFDFRQYFPTKADLSNEELWVLMEKIYHFIKQHHEQLIS